MTVRSGLTVAQAALGIACLALGLAALVAPADREDVLSVAVVGHLFWVAVFARELVAHRPTSLQPQCLVTLVTASACGAAEILGWWLCVRAGEADLAFWFLLAASFALAAAIIAARQEPGDATFVAQLGFHALMLLPLVSFAVQGTVSARAALHGSGSVVSGAGPLLRMTVLVGSLLRPCLLALLVVAVAINLHQPKPQRRPAWNALLAHQTAFLTILYRWCLDVA